MKNSELYRRLVDVGAAHVRTRGSHYLMRLPGGATVPLPFNHPAAEASRTVVASFRRVLREQGIELDSEAPSRNVGGSGSPRDRQKARER